MEAAADQKCSARQNKLKSIMIEGEQRQQAEAEAEAEQTDTHSLQSASVL